MDMRPQSCVISWLKSNIYRASLLKNKREISGQDGWMFPSKNSLKVMERLENNAFVIFEKSRFSYQNYQHVDRSMVLAVSVDHGGDNGVMGKNGSRH